MTLVSNVYMYRKRILTSLIKLNLGADVYARAYASAHVSNNDPAQFCFGLDGGALLFAEVQAPVLFGIDLNRYYVLTGGEVSQSPLCMGEISP